MRKSLLLIILFLFSINVFGQDHKILALNDNTYEFIKRLQTRGFLLNLNPNSLPYTYKSIQEGLETIQYDELNSLEKNWFNIIKERINQNLETYSPNINGLELHTSSTFSSDKRLDGLRPLRSGNFIYPDVKLSGFLGNKYFIGNLNITQNFYYDQDPDGLDTADRLYIRSEDSYVGLSYSNLSLYLGRFDQHWAPYKESSTILSNNPRSYDRFMLRYVGEKFSIESMLGELDNITDSGVFNGRAINEGYKRRFIAAHKIDWTPTNNFRLSYFESMLFSGQSSGLSLKYLNPLLVFGFESSNYPINDEVNLLMGGSLWWHINKLTLNGQFMLDDIHVNDNDEVTTFSLTGSIIKADIYRNIDVGYELEMVAYQTYNAPVAEGRYLYLTRGLATFGNDYILNKAYLNIYANKFLPGLTLKPTLHYLMQGEQKINQDIVRTYPDGSKIDIILTGTVEETLRASLGILYNPNSKIWVEVDAGYNSINNKSNIENNTKNNFGIILELGYRLNFASVRN